MPEIPKTFCPAKWDELMLNFSYDYVFACCKSTPNKYKNGNYIEIIDKQKENLLNGIQDPSCDYCWKVENKNLPSKRHEYLKLFDPNSIESYKTNKVEPKIVELYIGNECNFQCTYCNPKYSSQWEFDVKKKSYKIFTDRHFYGIDEKNQDLTTHTLEIVSALNKSSRLDILGGEPLLNKLFWQILEITPVENLYISTNLSCKTKKEIDRLYEKSSRFKNLHINVSLDSTNENAEFTRYGMNFQLFNENFNYLLENAPTNIKITIGSLITSVTVYDLHNFLNFIKEKKQKYQNLMWDLVPCTQPRIQSFDTLPEDQKLPTLKILNEIKLLDYVTGTNMVESALLSAKFNNTLYHELKSFLNEFSKRKDIKIPICLN